MREGIFPLSFILLYEYISLWFRKLGKTYEIVYFLSKFWSLYGYCLSILSFWLDSLETDHPSILTEKAEYPT